MIRQRTVLAVLYLVLLFGQVLAHPAVSVDQELILSATPLPFGKPAELVLTLSWNESAKFTPPEVEKLTVPGAKMLDGYMVSGGVGAQNRVSYHLVFTRFEPGMFKVGPVIIPSENGELKSAPLEMEFMGAEAKEGDKKGEIRSIKPVVELSTADFWKRLAAWVTGGLSLLMLLLAIVSYSGLLDRFRSPKSRALRRLKRLNRKTRQADNLLLESVDTLRDYLTSAYGLKATTSTSKELLRDLTMDNRCLEWKGFVEKMLEKADRVKFARSQVQTQEVDDLIQQLIGRLKSEKVRRRA